MAVSYKKSWELRVDKTMEKKNLRIAAGIISTAIAKLGWNEDIA